MSYNQDGQPQQAAPQQDAATGAAPAREANNPLRDRTFMLQCRNEQTNTTSYLRPSVEKNCIRLAADVSRDASGMWVSMLFPKVDWNLLKADIKRASTTTELPWSIKHVGKEADVTAGIDQEGMVYIAMSNKQGNETRFQFLATDYIQLVDMHGNPFSVSEMSRRRARGWVEEISDIVDFLWKRDYKDPEPRAPRQNGQGGGGQGNGYKKPWQGQGGGGGGYQKKPWQGQGGGGNYQKKPWQGQGGGGGNFQRNGGGGGGQWQNRQGGGGQGGYQPQQQQAPQAPAADVNFDDYNL